MSIKRIAEIRAELARHVHSNSVQLYVNMAIRDLGLALTALRVEDAERRDREQAEQAQQAWDAVGDLF